SPERWHQVRLIMVATAALFTACGGGSSPSSQPNPTAPTPSNGAPASSAQNWTVTHRFVSVTGADNCWIRSQRAGLTGAVFSNLDMTVTRTGNAITIASPWFV